jgi:hypothetical protein
VPREVGFVQLNWTERSAPCAGFDLQPALLGAAAVDSVVAQLQRTEQGIPAHTKTITLAARWVEGPTLRSFRRGNIPRAHRRGSRVPADSAGGRRPSVVGA